MLHDTYTLGPLLGDGGMGEVYEAAHTRLPGRYAVKILRPELLTNQEAVRRFCREAEIMSALRHPHIIQIFDFNTSVEGLPYFAMEYLDGVDLQVLLGQTGALPLADVVRIVDAVASALAAAHAIGVVHRDLKPANVFLIRGERQDEDFVKVIDFGISKTTHHGPSLSMPTELLGTPAFMAPEQALGHADRIDARSDQFALAALTHLMLTGREPFEGGDPLSVLYQVVHAQPASLSEFFAWDTGAIQAVLDKGMAKRPEDRFGDVVAFSSALASGAAALRPGASPPLAHVRSVRLVPKAPLPPSSDVDVDVEMIDDPPPPIKLAGVRPPVLRLVEDLDQDIDEEAAEDLHEDVDEDVDEGVDEDADVDVSELPQPIDRIPRGPQRAVVLGLAVLGLAAVIVHKDWYRGLPLRAAGIERAVMGVAQRGWHTPPPNLATPIPDQRPVSQN